MDFTEENLPLVKVLMRPDNKCAPELQRDFEAARNGGLKEKLDFAIGIQTMVEPDTAWYPDQTREINERTLQSCMGIFQEAVQAGTLPKEDADMAAIMVAEFERRGITGPDVITGIGENDPSPGLPV
jgi:hypothetical protein